MRGYCKLILWCFSFAIFLHCAIQINKHLSDRVQSVCSKDVVGQGNSSGPSDVIYSELNETEDDLPEEYGGPAFLMAQSVSIQNIRENFFQPEHEVAVIIPAFILQRNLRI